MAANPDHEHAERVLQSLPGMARAHVSGQLSDGPSNASFRAETPFGPCVLRLDKAGADDLGLDRNNEKQMTQRVADAGLAPAFLVFEPDEGVSLRRFLPGRTWTPGDLRQADNLARLATVLRKLHRLEPAGAPFEPVAAARRYAERLDHPGAYETLKELEMLNREVSAMSPRPAHCHNDLVCRNIIDGERLVLIDWEYTGTGDPYFDLAVVVQHHSLEHELALGFLQAYLERTPSNSEVQHLDLQCRFYEQLLTLWTQLHPN
jgi:thiamine kinase-like enzyme